LHTPSGLAEYDQEALDAVMEVIEQDGIKSFLDGDPEAMH